MPELPEVEAVRRELAPVFVGARIVSVVLRRDGLRRPFPSDFVDRVRGQTVVTLDRRGKYILVRLASGDTLLMHLGMSGSFRIVQGAPVAARQAGPEGGPDGAQDGGPADPHDHVIFGLASGARIIFNDPRRFGVMDVIAPIDDAKALALGPEPLDDAFDGAVLARACQGARAPLKTLLLDQRVVAGLGNIYAAEALHAARLSPLRKGATIATGAGRPRQSAVRLADAIKSVLRTAIDRGERPYRASRFLVYDRAGRRCPRRACQGTVRRIVQGGRSTFYCPRCQR